LAVGVEPLLVAAPPHPRHLGQRPTEGVRAQVVDPVRVFRLRRVRRPTAIAARADFHCIGVSRRAVSEGVPRPVCPAEVEATPMRAAVRLPAADKGRSAINRLGAARIVAVRRDAVADPPGPSIVVADRPTHIPTPPGRGGVTRHPRASAAPIMRAVSNVANCFGVTSRSRQPSRAPALRFS